MGVGPEFAARSTTSAGFHYPFFSVTHGAFLFAQDEWNVVVSASSAAHRHSSFSRYTGFTRSYGPDSYGDKTTYLVYALASPCRGQAQPLLFPKFDSIASVFFYSPTATNPNSNLVSQSLKAQHDDAHRRQPLAFSLSLTILALLFEPGQTCATDLSPRATAGSFMVTPG